MLAAGVDLPSFGITHSPGFHSPVVNAGNDQRNGWVECSVVDASVVALENILHSSNGVERVKAFGESIRRVHRRASFSKSGNIPISHTRTVWSWPTETTRSSLVQM